jgi:molybdopterin-guanine dinucleotide biosynthesis protein A
MTISSISGFILVGGASSRMGTDKALLKFEGQTFVERIASELSGITNSVALVGRTNQNFDPPLPTIPDVYERWGALGGIHGALVACQSPWALIVACDLPFVNRSLFAHLAELRENFDAVAPIQGDGRPQPLCALYARAPCLSQAEHLIKTGERKPIGLLQSVSTRWVRFSELEHLTGHHHFFDNINTPQDYARANLCPLDDDQARSF